MLKERVGTSLSVLLLLFGLIGAWIEGGRGEGSQTKLPARGEFWRVVNSAGLTKQVSGPILGIPIRPGDRISIDEELNDDVVLDDLELRFQDPGIQSGQLKVHFRSSSDTSHRLSVLVGESIKGTLALHVAGKPSEKLISGSLPGSPGQSKEAFDFRLRNEGADFVVEVRGQQLLRLKGTTLPLRRAALRADEQVLLAISASGEIPRSEARSTPFAKQEDLSEFAGREATGLERLLALLAWSAVFLVGTFGYLRHLCLGVPPFALVTRSTMRALAPPAAVLGVSPFVPALLTTLLGLFALTLGLKLALQTLAAHLNDNASESSRSALRHGLWIIALMGATTWICVETRTQPVANDIRAAEQAQNGLSKRSFDLTAPKELDAANALTVPGRYRSLDLSAQVSLESESLFELRFRTQAGGPIGIALFLSSDSRWPSGFVLESRGRFAPLGDRFEVFESGMPIALEVHIEGDDYEARIDGEVVARARSREFPVGRVMALAARGTVTIDELSLVPIDPEPAIRSAVDEAIDAAKWPWLWFAMLGLLTAALFRTGTLRSLEASAWMIVPAAASLHAWGEATGRMTIESMALGCSGFAIACLPWCLLRAKQAGWIRSLLFYVSAASSSLYAMNSMAGPPITHRAEAGSIWDEFDLPRIEPELSHLQHPYLRRMNGYLRDHRFRGREFALRAAPGTTRILCLGGSSTWGHGIPESSGQDYPTLLEQRLNAGRSQGPVEVINAAVKGSSGPRLLRLLEESLLAFKPRIVTLSLYYNDSHYLSKVDEEAYLTRVSAPGFERDALDHLRELLHRRRKERIVGQLWQRHNQGQHDTLQAWKEIVGERETTSPPERFETALRGFAELGRQHDFQLVLIKEPIRGNPDRIWRDEFRAAMDRVGADYDLTVVDPEEAIAAAGGSELFMDEVHPLASGHRVMAELLLPTIEALISD